MGLNDTPSGDRLHIGFFGRRNAGKSSVVNAVTGQELAVVSDVKGTTTDPVRKAMELLPLGPVMIIDTPGFDDEGALGELRVRKTRQVLNKTDIAVLVVDAEEGMRESDRQLIGLFREKELAYLIVFNKADLLSAVPAAGEREIYVSAKTKQGIQELKERLAALQPREAEKHLVGDLLSPGDLAILVVPIDKAAPKGRLILPQQQTIRDLLDCGCAALTVRDSELAGVLARPGMDPAVVITDSQVFGAVSKLVPETVPLTSFSILMARHKGLLEDAVAGVSAIKGLRDGDTVLIAEGCTHHRQCGDIGTVKLPKAVAKLTGKKLNFVFCSGGDFPLASKLPNLVIHCGGCMLTRREMVRRMELAREAGVPITNYGLVLAAANGIVADPATCMVRRGKAEK